MEMRKHMILAVFSALIFASVPTGARQVDSVLTTGTRALVVKGGVLEYRMPGDVRNQLTGRIPGLEVTEDAGGWWNSGSYETFVANSGQLSMKYRGNAYLTCIIDGMAVPYGIYSLDPSQIESITLIGDVVDRVKFGPLASNGAISIKTKTGGYNQPLTIRTNVESGVALTGIVPEWADGVDYAILNNQARAQAGYTQLYSPLAIQGFLRGDAYDLKYPNVDYRSLMLGSMMPVGNASVSVSGGSNTVKYAVSLSELYTGDIVKTDQIQDFNKVNVSANLTTRINRLITVQAGFNGHLSFRRSGRVGWNAWQDVPPVAYPVILGVNESADVGDELAGLTIYGTTSQFPDNAYALLAEGGFSTRRIRSGMVFMNVGMDFSPWVKGLRSDTQIAYSTFVGTTVSKNNDYLSYYWNPAAENGMDKISPTHQGIKASGKGISSTGANQILQFRERLGWDWEKNGHAVSLGGSFLMFDASMQGVGYYRRLMQGIADAKYTFGGRYILEGAFQYVGSTRFERKNRFRPFGSVGAAWVVSNEPFLRDVSWIDLLKVRGQFGTVGKYSSAFGTEYLYQSDYDRANGYTYGPVLTMDTWFGNKSWVSQKTTVTKIANPLLTWESDRHWEAGLDFDFCHGFSLAATVYGVTTQGVIEEASAAVPAVFGLGSSTVYANVTSNETFGYELSLDWRRSFGDFAVHAGACAYHWNTLYRKLLTDDYIYPYQKKTDTPSSSIWGYECIGKYENAEQIATVPSYSDVIVGDLMYKDQNGDDSIDTNDRVIIGNTQPALRYSLILGFRYKGLGIEAVATGRYRYDRLMNDDYFWSGWGDGNYSAFVRDNIGGAYPTLSYVKSTNNFVNSSFWIQDASWFKLQDVSLSYDVPLRAKKVVKGLTFTLKGQNLATVTRMRYIDPEAPDSGIGSYPLFRTFMAGVKFNF